MIENRSWSWTVPEADDITELLLAWNRGEASAMERLVPLVHAELHRLAHLYMRGERPGHTLQTTALVNEAYLRLVDCSRVQWRGRTHFMAMAASLMRRILIDLARERMAGKRGGDSPFFSLDAASGVAEMRSRDLVALDDALDALAQVDPRKAKVIEMRFFGGMEAKETAEALGVSEDTVLRDWKLAKAWLLRELGRGGSS